MKMCFKAFGKCPTLIMFHTRHLFGCVSQLVQLSGRLQLTPLTLFLLSVWLCFELMSDDGLLHWLQ